MARKCVGRKRVVLQKVEDKAKRQVTCSKRRGGLFKKSSELCTLVGAEVAIITFSPGGKVYSFGHPSVDTVLDRYLGEGPYEVDESEQFYQAYRSSKQLELNKHVTELEGLIAEAERQSRETDEMMRQMFAQRQFWWEKDHREFSYEESEAFEGMLDRLKDSSVMQLSQVNEDAPASNHLNQAEVPFSSANGGHMDTRALLDQFNGSTVPFEPAPSGADQSSHVVPPYIFADHEYGSHGDVPYEPLGERSGPGVPVDTETPLVFNTRGSHDAALLGSTSTRLPDDPASHIESTDTETPPTFNMRALSEALLLASSSTAVTDDPIGIKSSQEETPFVSNWDPGFINMEAYNPVAAAATLDGGPSFDSGPLGPGGSLDNVASHDEAGASHGASLSLSDFESSDFTWIWDDPSPNI